MSELAALNPILPTTSSYNGRLISYLAPEIMETLANKDELPDSVKAALEDGCRVLAIF